MVDEPYRRVGMILPPPRIWKGDQRDGPFDFRDGPFTLSRVS